MVECNYKGREYGSKGNLASIRCVNDTNSQQIGYESADAVEQHRGILRGVI